MTARDSSIRLPFSAGGGSLRPFAAVINVCSPVDGCWGSVAAPKNPTRVKPDWYAFRFTLATKKRMLIRTGMMPSHVYYMSGDAWKEGGIDATDTDVKMTDAEVGNLSDYAKVRLLSSWRLGTSLDGTFLILLLLLFLFWIVCYISFFALLSTKASHVYYMSGDAWKEGGIDATGNRLLLEGLKSELEKSSPSLGHSAIYAKDSRINGLPRYLTIQFKVDYPLELDVYDICSDDLRKRLEVPRRILRDEEGKKLGLKTNEKGSTSTDTDVKMTDAEGPSNGSEDSSKSAPGEGIHLLIVE
ncbi:ubiquitin carboxyl-terminal hydrolase 6 [Phtheirospermum japonicum]|uniref:ubiquitinyl hydrolase 1 n=1 Tax=Phtheirospermum japonicum TaxID=374723 RepID=A0A830BEG0_9LAMI|nr:ubiquitin carboxyl-terminal hydrolase 6 [Phtheirospermum japonicum]